MSGQATPNVGIEIATMATAIMAGFRDAAERLQQTRKALQDERDDRHPRLPARLLEDLKHSLRENESLCRDYRKMLLTLEKTVRTHLPHVATKLHHITPANDMHRATESGFDWDGLYAELQEICTMAHKDELVTLNQVAILAKVSKKTLENHKPALPKPKAMNGKGRTFFYSWNELRPAVEPLAGRPLPLRFPEIS
jgi:hypothetical protein